MFRLVTSMSPIHECMQREHRQYRSLFDSFPAAFIDWRWGSLRACLEHLATVHVILALCWSTVKMRNRSQRDSEVSSAKGEVAAAFSLDDNSEAVGAVISDGVFWCYLHMLLCLGDGAERLLQWMQSCSCHRSRVVRKACNLTVDVDASSELRDSCPLQGLPK